MIIKNQDDYNHFRQFGGFATHAKNCTCNFCAIQPDIVAVGGIEDVLKVMLEFYPTNQVVEGLSKALSYHSAKLLAEYYEQDNGSFELVSAGMRLELLAQKIRRLL